VYIFRSSYFCPRAHLAAYTTSIEKVRPVLQGLLAIDHLTKEGTKKGGFEPRNGSQTEDE
ncbi:hypothetical protein HN51_001858, partial [Arachis hypogaea]